MERLNQQYSDPPPHRLSPNPPDEILRDLMLALAITMSHQPQAMAGLRKLRKQIHHIQIRALMAARR